MRWSRFFAVGHCNDCGERTRFLATAVDHVAEHENGRCRQCAAEADAAAKLAAALEESK